METLPTRASRQPSEYERRALREIELWRRPSQRGWWGKAMHRMDVTLNDATEMLRKVPGVSWTLDTVVAGLLHLTNEIAQDSIWQDAIYAGYQQQGHPVTVPVDVHRLDLSTVDARLQGLAAKYRALAAAEGAATGYAGLPGILPDVFALVALNLRAAGEYSTYCGFDLERPMERLYALQILDAVASPGGARKDLALKPLYKISSRLARAQALQVAEQAALTQALRNATRALGLRLTKAKLAQVVPVTGAVIAGGFNAYYTSKVCDHAHFLYRERFLMHKYGPAILGQ